MNKVQKALLSRLPETVDLSKITTIAIPLCLGDPKNLEDGCHDRFNAAIRGLGNYYSKILVIQTGGTHKKPLCEKMLEAVKSGKKYLWASRFLAIQLGWGTRSEIANLFFIINQLSKDNLKDGINTKSPDFKIIIASNKAHLSRIKWFVYVYNFNNLHVDYQEAQHDFSLRDTIREWIGTPIIRIKDRFCGSEKLGFKKLLDSHEKIFCSRF
jgi:hypothetical protein